mgnify:CR=1 FL=1
MVLGLSLALLVAQFVTAADALVLDGRRQLFVVDFLVESMTNLTRTVHQPMDITGNPVILPEHPWEHRRIPFGSVLYFAEEQKFKCWYLAMNIYDSRPGGRGYRKDHHVPIQEAAVICYAESEDGVHWRKPMLRLHDFRGSKENNIVLRCPGTHFDSTSVIHTPWDRVWPYKMMTFIGLWPYQPDLIRKQWGDTEFGIHKHGHYAFGSKNGIHWTMLNGGEPVVQAHDRSMFWWDSGAKLYVGAAKQSHNGKRAQRYAWSRDFMHWTITPDLILYADEWDHSGDEGEAAYVFQYGAQYVGFAELRRVRKGMPTLINWELLCSRDGRDWSRPLRHLFFSDAGTNTWRYQVLKVFANPPIECDGRLFIYYSGKTGMNDAYTGTGPNQALCLATLRMDGFVSIDAGNTDGTLITRPVNLDGKQLFINADATGGEIRAALIGNDGKALSGFDLEKCEPVKKDTLRGAVRWRDAENLAGANDQPVRLRIQLRNASLYSIWTE